MAEGTGKGQVSVVPYLSWYWLVSPYISWNDNLEIPFINIRTNIKAIKAGKVLQ